MFDLTNVLSTVNSLLILGILVFFGAIALLILLSGVSASTTLKKFGNLAIIFAFSLSVPLVYSKIENANSISQAKKKVAFQQTIYTQINPGAFRLVLKTEEKAACYLEYTNPQNKKISVVFPINENQKDLAPQTEHEFLIFDNGFSQKQASFICEGSRMALLSQN